MAQEESGSGPAQDESNIVSQIGPVEVDWPRTVGFYGGLAIAVSMEMITAPLALFIAAYPLLKMLNRPQAPRAVRIVSQVLEGAAQPLNGDAEGTIRVVSNKPLLPHVKPKAPRQLQTVSKTQPAPRPKLAPTAKPARKTKPALTPSTPA